MAIYAIGDVQGCFATLQTLLDAIAFDRTRDQLWFVGDLVNRGPRSLDVLRFVKALGDRAVTVLGNHDMHLLAVAYGRAGWKPTDTLDGVLVASDRDTLLTWLRHRPLLHHDVSLGAILVYAGLPPQWTPAMARTHAAEVEARLRGPSYLTALDHLVGAATADDSEAHERWPWLRYVTDCLTKLRYCDAEGRLALAYKGLPGTQPAPYLPWFLQPERASADQTIIFGHWSALGWYTAPGIYALDTGCAWGRTLTAMCMETQELTSVAYCD